MEKIRYLLIDGESVTEMVLACDCCGCAPHTIYYYNEKNYCFKCYFKIN